MTKASAYKRKRSASPANQLVRCWTLNPKKTHCYAGLWTCLDAVEWVFGAERASQNGFK